MNLDPIGMKPVHGEQPFINLEGASDELLAELADFGIIDGPEGSEPEPEEEFDEERDLKDPEFLERLKTLPESPVYTRNYFEEPVGPYKFTMGADGVVQVDRTESGIQDLA